MAEPSPKTIWRLQVQGFAKYSPEQLKGFQPGIRFAYVGCGTIVLVGILFAHVPTLAVLALIAFAGAVMPNHPFDYIYNFALRFLIDQPAIPKRSPQTKFACAVATVWVLITIYLFMDGSFIAGQIWGTLLVALAYLVGFTDICIPSMIYNLATRKKVNPFEDH